MSTTPHQYIDNKRLVALLSKWVDERKAAIEANQKLPPVPEEVGQAALQIAIRLSKKPNFMNYSFIEDMIAEALLNVVKGIHNFDVAKSTNAFAYMTTLINNAFIHIINKEKRIVLTKMHYSEMSNDVTPELHQYYSIVNRKHEAYSKWRQVVEDKAEAARERRNIRKAATAEGNKNGTNMDHKSTMAMVREVILQGVNDPKTIAQLVNAKLPTVHQCLGRIRKEASKAITAP